MVRRCDRDVLEVMGGLRCFQVLLAEAGRAGFLVMLERSVAVVLVASTSQCGYCQAGSYRKYRGEMHIADFCSYEGVLAAVDQ